MGCACSKNKTASKITYEVTYRNGSKETFDSATKANASIRRKGGGSMRPKQG
jgi:hypothetical protein